MENLVYICVSCSFEAAQLAFSKLWRKDGEIPKRNDMKIISALPTEGSQQTFKYILGIGIRSMSKGVKTNGEFKLEPPKGTDTKNLTPKNYVFTVIRKSANIYFQAQVRVRPEIFPAGFFKQRKIVEFGIPREATEEEREEFEKWERGVRDKFLTLPQDNLFVSKMWKG